MLILVEWPSWQWWCLRWHQTWEGQWCSEIPTQRLERCTAEPRPASWPGTCPWTGGKDHLGRTLQKASVSGFGGCSSPVAQRPYGPQKLVQGLEQGLAEKPHGHWHRWSSPLCWNFQTCLNWKQGGGKVKGGEWGLWGWRQWCDMGAIYRMWRVVKW